jgi:diguanylate cyclase
MMAAMKSGSEGAYELELAELGALLDGARALIELDDAHAAKAEIVRALDVVERLCGREPAAGERLVDRLATLDSADVPPEVGRVIAEAMRLGLRSSMLSNDVESALPFGRVALAFASRLGMPLLAAQAHNDMASVYGIRDFHERATYHLRAGIEVLERAGERVFPALVNNLGNVYMATDRVEEALACFDRSAQGAAEEGDEMRRAIALSNRGRALSALRRHDEAIAALKDALGLFRSLNRRAYVATTLAKLGTAHTAAGDLATAMTYFQKAAQEIDDPGLPFRGEVVEAIGRALLEAGEARDALAELERAEELHREVGAFGAAAALQRDQARALALLGRHEEAFDRLMSYLEETEAQQQEHGEVLLGVLLVELEAGLTRDNELLAITGRALAEANRALRAQAERLERLSATDELTQVYNRRYLNGRLQDAVVRCRQDPTCELSLVLFDVDEFKAINDNYSHLVGDEVLRKTAAVLAGTFRRTDVVARWGGEEFAVMLTSTTKEAAERVADRAREAVAAADWSEVAPGLEVTVSAGVASVREMQGGPNALELLRLADRRLYLAKSSGRNRVTAGD